MLKELISLANSLDERGFKKEADYLDNIVKKLAMNWDDEDWGEPSDKELDNIMEEEKKVTEEAEAVSAEEILSAAMNFIQNPEVPEGSRESFKRRIIDTIGNDLMVMGGFGWGGTMERGGPGISPTGLPVAEAKAKTKKKLSKKQLALDKNNNGEIDSEDFELLRKKKSKVE